MLVNQDKVWPKGLDCFPKDRGAQTPHLGFGNAKPAGAVMAVRDLAQARKFEGIDVRRQSEAGDLIHAGGQNDLRFRSGLVQCGRNRNLATYMPTPHTVVRVEEKAHQKGYKGRFT